MNYILYLGPDDFRGLIGGLPERPNVTLTCTEDCQGECGDFCPIISGAKERLRQWGLQVESLKANAPKVVNSIEELALMGIEIKGLLALQIGQSVELPEGYEFKEEYQWKNEIGYWWTVSKFDYELLSARFETRTVLRIVKTEPKKNVILGKNSCIHRDGNLQIGQVKTEVKEDLRLGFSKEWLKKYPHLATQPSPEESQKELLDDLLDMYDERRDRNHLLKHFLIHRKK